jgi:molybdopterin-synthase adenylyltransferase
MLDYDVVFSCVDRPWPRHVMNVSAYADVLSVIDGGLRLEPAVGGGLRNAYCRSHIAGPGRPCLSCIGQYDPGDVQADRDGSLDAPSYIASLPPGSPLVARQNVSALSIAAASAQLNQFLSLVVAPAGFGDPGPLRFSLATHRLEHLHDRCVAGCPYQASVGIGDGRIDATSKHALAENARFARGVVHRRPRVRLARLVDDGLTTTARFLSHIPGQR